MKRRLEQKRKDTLRHSSGLSLVELLISLSLVVVLVLGAGMLMRRMNKASDSSHVSYHLQGIRSTLLESFDCVQSLNITPMSPTPICNNLSANIPILRENGSSIPKVNGNTQTIGKWTINARCENNQIIFAATRPGTNSFGKLWSELPDAKDLFRGASDFCRNYFDPPQAACPTNYPLQAGSTNGKHTCCRKQTHEGVAPFYISWADCSSSEYLAAGGGSCWAEGGGEVGRAPNDPSYIVRASTLYSKPNIAGNTIIGWTHDCHGIPTNIKGPHESEPTDVFSQAHAICCPN